MRNAWSAFALLLLAGCMSMSGGATRQYLDSVTAATLTVAASEWIFARERPEAAVNVRDYLSLHAVEVNRSGDRRVYLVTHAWSTVNTGERPPARPPRLNVVADGRLVSLQAVDAEPVALGIGQPIVRPRGTDARVWYYPVTLEALSYITASRQISAALRGEALHAQYLPWRDARRSFEAFLAALPRPVR